MVGQVKHQVRVSREGRWWVAEVDGVPGGATEVRRLTELDTEVRDLLSGLLDLAEDEVELDYDFRPAFGEDAADAWKHFLAERDELYRRQTELDEQRRTVVRALHDQGVSTRDLGELLDLSHQRVSQLLDA